MFEAHIIREFDKFTLPVLIMVELNVLSHAAFARYLACDRHGRPSQRARTGPVVEAAGEVYRRSGIAGRPDGRRADR
jgi:hypothetical protein